MAFSVRLAQASDIAQIDLLYSRSYPKLLKPDYAPSLLVTVIPMFSKAQPQLVSSGSFFVAETSAGDIVGAGGWTKRGPMGEATRGLGHVRHFATDPDLVRAGVGRALMNACFDQASGAGMARLSCYSTLTAVPFYEAMGFRQKGPIEIAFGQAMQFPAIWMDRELL